MGLPKAYFNRGYRDFHLDYKEVDTPEEKLTLKEYKTFIRDFFDECFLAIMRSKTHITMPFGLGDFYLKEIKPGGFYARNSWINRHTFGKCFKFHWDQTYAVFSNLPYIDFKKHDNLKRKLKKFYRDVKAGRERSPQVYSYPIKTYTRLD